MRKIVAFLGLLAVAYALAVQHGVFDRAGSAGTAAAATVETPAEPAHAACAPDKRQKPRLLPRSDSKSCRNFRAGRAGAY
jgi:hypothetical protein